MTSKKTPSRRDWLPWALAARFGEEPEVADPWPSLLRAVSSTAAEATEVGRRVQECVRPLRAKVDGLPSLDSLSFDIRGLHDVEAPMRVVLMGRTMAGKSSLLSALTGQRFDRIGDGRQRVSRDVFAAPATFSRGIEIVDTPGVGAHKGGDDANLAVKTARGADLVLWVASSDSIQEETARALRLMAVIGKPVVIALNCRQSLEGIGRTTLMRYPERVFGQRNGLVGEIRRHLATAGVTPLEVVYLHALAATSSVTDDDAALREASRLDDLVSVLLHQHATHAESRRAIRLVDSFREPIEGQVLALATAIGLIRSQATLSRAVTLDVQARLSRLVRSAAEAMRADVESVVGRRRDWHLGITDFGASLSKAWDEELQRMQADLDEVLDERTRQVAADLQVVSDSARDEWALSLSGRLTLGDLTGFDSVLGNRLLRAGIGLGGAAVGAGAGWAAGAAIGAMVGGPAAPITAAVGALVLAVLPSVTASLKSKVDRLFLGKDGVLRKRRAEVARKVGPLLDVVVADRAASVSSWELEMSSHLNHTRDLANQDASALDDAAARLSAERKSLRSMVKLLDRELTTALLRLAGRERLARSVLRSTRVPGVCILAELDESEFWEAWLYPPDLGETMAGGKVPDDGGEAVGSLSYALGLVDAPIHLVRSDADSALLRIEDDLPDDILQTWGDALSTQVNRRIQFQAARRV